MKIQSKIKISLTTTSSLSLSLSFSLALSETTSLLMMGARNSGQNKIFSISLQNNQKTIKAKISPEGS
jgi:hypothetical protein